MDSINDRFGKMSVTYGTLLPGKEKAGSHVIPPSWRPDGRFERVVRLIKKGADESPPPLQNHCFLLFQFYLSNSPVTCTGV